MPKVNDIRELAQKNALYVSNSPRDWMGYLDVAARLYRYSFSDTLLIHAQRPDATACAEMKLWNGKMNRWVNRGAKGIALIDDTGPRIGLRYVFDISDTHIVNGGRTPLLWNLDSHEHEQAILDHLADTYGLSQTDSILLELKKYYSDKIIQFFFKLNDTELNQQLRWEAFYHLQSFNYQPRARRQKYMQIHTKNKKRKKFLKEVYPIETYEIPQNPNELEYRIENSREQQIKEYDYFISHSSKDSIHVQKLIRAENQDGKNIFCDWINDVDYLKRHLLCEATLKVLEKRMEQSKAMIFLVSENSLHSSWCKYELNYFTELGKPIYCISKEAIEEKNFHLGEMNDTWFLDSDYKTLALIEGKSINA